MLNIRLFNDHINELMNNQNNTTDTTLQNLVTPQEYEELLSPVIRVMEENPEASFEELKEILYNQSPLKAMIRDFIHFQCLAPGLTMDFGTINSRKKIKCGLQEDVANLNGRKVYKPTPMDYDTIFDLASTSKVFTMLAILKLNEEQRIDLFMPVKNYVPEFQDLEDVTIFDLLKFRVHVKTKRRVDEAKNPKEAREILLTAYKYPKQDFYNNYTDIGAMILRIVVEKITATPFTIYINETILKPLNMDNTFLIVPPEKISMVASENYSMRLNSDGLVTIQDKTFPGLVQDSKSLAIGASMGIAPGHAGYFSNASDMIKLAQAIMNYELLNAQSVASICENAVGKKIDDNYSWYYGSLVYSKQPVPNKLEVYNKLSGQAFMSPGFTGTSLYVDPINKISLFFGSNRLHNRIYDVSPSQLNSILTDPETGKQTFELPNGTKEIVSLNYARQKEALIQKALDLALQYQLLEKYFPTKDRSRKRDMH